MNSIGSAVSGQWSAAAAVRPSKAAGYGPRTANAFKK